MKNVNIKDKSKLKNIFIVLLIILVLLLTIFLIFSKIKTTESTESISFLQDINNLQNKLSYYTGVTYSDTFGLYDKVQILSGIVDENGERKIITNNKNEQITSLIDLESKIEKNKTVYYKLVSENIKKVLDIDIAKYEGIDFYVQNAELIKVKFDTKPTWWTSSLDVFLVGNT